jgi:hypothetical protein
VTSWGSSSTSFNIQGGSAPLAGAGRRERPRQLPPNPQLSQSGALPGVLRRLDCLGSREQLRWHHSVDHCGSRAAGGPDLPDLQALPVARRVREDEDGCGCLKADRGRSGEWPREGG